SKGPWPLSTRTQGRLSYFDSTSPSSLHGSRRNARASSANSMTSMRRSPPSIFATYECGRFSRSARPRCVSPACILASARTVHSIRCSRLRNAFMARSDSGSACISELALAPIIGACVHYGRCSQNGSTRSSRMLVLSRRLNQSIVIGGAVRVTVLAITPSRVEIGVEAPREIMVDREEIHLRRQVEGERSFLSLTYTSQK